MPLKTSELDEITNPDDLQPANDYLRVFRQGVTTGKGAGPGGKPYRITIGRIFRRGVKALFGGGAINTLPDLTAVGPQTVGNLAQAQTATNNLQQKLDATLDQLNKIKNQLKVGSN